MINLNGYGRITNRLVCSIWGLSFDVKPTYKIESISVENGSVFIFDKEKNGMKFRRKNMKSNSGAMIIPKFVFLS